MKPLDVACRCARKVAGLVDAATASSAELGAFVRLCAVSLRVPLVDGQETAPLERVVAAADFGNGVSKVFDMDEVLFVNPNLNVLLYRLPVGEWICLDAVTRFGDQGVALAESLLFDEQGPIGRSAQTLLVEPR